MSDDRVRGYAAGLLELARAEGVVARVSDELYRIARALETSADLRLTLGDPRLPLERKHGIVADLLGSRVLPLTLNLVNFVVAAGHSRDLPAIADDLAARAAAERDRVVAEVSTAFELDEETVQRLAEALSRATGKQVEVKTVIDTSLVGGVVARVGDTVIDGSLRHRLEGLRQALQRR
ncbi:MAG: ATP synthase F1 subunit delta [Acidimicrobiia bacterium]|jgi:F-type H+-transporting ATPase subunit delta|nr:ATP synthase F1 subunit delta [Acidimicrobiia bacterium]